MYVGKESLKHSWWSTNNATQIRHRIDFGTHKKRYIGQDSSTADDSADDR